MFSFDQRLYCLLSIKIGICVNCVFALFSLHLTIVKLLFKLLFFSVSYVLFFSDDVRQFVIVTSIDELGVPNDDMRSAYKYGCIRKICEKISEILDIDLPHVIPVSNYFAEVAPTTAKNAMSLMNMWRVCNSSKEFILRKRKQTSANFIT